jgi:hypothetical protein
MADEHVPRRRMERFLRAGLPRPDNRRIVRHLLAECHRCSAVAGATARATGVSAALSRFGRNSAAPDPARYSRAFASILGIEAEEACRPDLQEIAGPEIGALRMLLSAG